MNETDARMQPYPKECGLGNPVPIPTVLGFHVLCRYCKKPWEELLAGGRFEDWLKDFSAALAALRDAEGGKG